MSPSKAHHDFVHWYVDGKDENTPYDFSSILTASIRLIAKWHEHTKYAVQFNLNGADGTIAQQNVYAGDTVQKPDNPTRTGYNFVHWYVSGGDENNIAICFPSDVCPRGLIVGCFPRILQYEV